MSWKVTFQYKPAGHARPYDYVQDDHIELESLLALPNVGDTVDYKEDDKIVTRKVVSRHFSFSYPDNYWVNVVVTDPAPGEMAVRLKE